MSRILQGTWPNKTMINSISILQDYWINCDRTRLVLHLGYQETISWMVQGMCGIFMLSSRETYATLSASGILVFELNIRDPHHSTLYSMAHICVSMCYINTYVKIRKYRPPIHLIYIVIIIIHWDIRLLSRLLAPIYFEDITYNQPTIVQCDNSQVWSSIRGMTLICM
jgi:hypothetical protein